jgi:hypothetical protein
MATVGHVTAWAERKKYQAASFLLNRVYILLNNAVLAFLTNAILRQTNLPTVTSKEITGLGDSKFREHQHEWKIDFTICLIIVNLYTSFQDNCCVP